MLTRVSVEVLEMYVVHDVIYLKIVVDNMSYDPVSMTNASLKDDFSGVVFKPVYDEKIITSSSSYSLKTSKIPVNINQKYAECFYLAFPTKDTPFKGKADNSMTLSVKISKKEYTDEYKIIEKMQDIQELRSRSLR